MVWQAKKRSSTRGAAEPTGSDPRHIQGRAVRVADTSDHQGLRVAAEDDGRGTRALQPGNGLTGMRERFADLGGTVEFTTSPGAGFSLSAQVPT